ncbi:MAG: pentapeptide repeat-containing protein [Acidobacteriota bacterium]
MSAKFRATASFSDATFSGDAGFASASFNADAYFSDVSFSADAYFMSAKFGSKANFISATFCSAANFSNATFNANADFSYATLSFKATFVSTRFGGFARFVSTKFCAAADFSSAIFMAEAEFSFAVFSKAADFSLAKFNKVGYFDSAVFDDSVRFFGDAQERYSNNTAHIGETALGKEPSLDFQHVRIEHPERIAFHTLNLRPHWFVNVDSRKFIFTDVGWEWDRISIKQEIAALEDKRVSSPNRLLAIACRHLAENAEVNNRYEEASRFRYWAMDLARRTKWKGWSFWKTDWLHMLYWAVSGYGERILRALGVLAAVWIVFVLFYTRVGFVQQPPKASNEGASPATAATMTIEDKIGQPLEFSRALTYSLAVMSLQKPDPRPLTNWAHALVTLETILGPVQAALLALAIRRKFMR